MKAVFILCALVVAVSARPEEQYTDKYDNVNYQEVVENDRLLDSYYKCVMEEGKCTNEGKELRLHITDALETECSKCTPKQKEGTKYVIGHLINQKPKYWEELRKKYDPKNKFANKYEKELKKVSS